MASRQEQVEGFAKMLDLMMVPKEDQPQVLKGVNTFFDQGWPSNFFTVGMAARAGAGLVPPEYEGVHSQSQYLALMDAKPSK